MIKIKSKDIKMNELKATALSTQYDVAFYESRRSGSRRSAEIVLSRVFDWLRPTSVVDVGCGEGCWLDVAGKLGVDDLLGLDGNYVDRSRLAIPQDRFRSIDLSQPFHIDRTFDLAMSLEVAEHLVPEAADQFISSLVTLAPAVLFSAAIPGQGGTDHRNEQWASYWTSLFARHGYVCFDMIRPIVWHDDRIEVWYRQNTFLYLAGDHSAAAVDPFGVSRTNRPMDCVHPELLRIITSRFESLVTRAQTPRIRVAARRLRDALWRRLRGGVRP